MPFVGEFSALLTALLWSGSALIFTTAVRRAGSFQVNITRLIFAVLYIVLLIFVMRFNVNLSISQIINLSISGIVGLALGDTFLFKAFREIGARVSMLIMSLAPAIAALLAYFVLDETLPFLGVAGIIVTVFGICFVILDRGANPSEKISPTASGIIYALLGAAGQGVGLIFAKMAFREAEVNGFVASGVRIAAALTLLLPAAIATKRFKSPVRMFREDRKGFRLTAIGSVLGPFLGISFSLIAIQYTDVGVAAAIMAIPPILMLPLVRFVYREKLRWPAIIGACIAVAGVVVLFLR